MCLICVLVSGSLQAHGLVYDQGQYDANQFNEDMIYCEGLAHQLPQEEAPGLVEETAKRGARGAAAGAVAGSVSGNSGSDAAKTGAAVGMTLVFLEIEATVKRLKQVTNRRTPT
ncbi:hypothetical protein JCM19232_329 [Vibrio ishigakensis]|uniref:Glycine-zipper-containing OmpA-like membrane domain-containing protein n=1 Tax=Vibrio ishigakensis TaxID=1481914 RepID=A0A0B8P1C2_9VIBR|nr:hypothetical protein JCM19232_329 [Vibrio ishigakensis]